MRVVVVGTSGSGKTTMAKRLSQALGVRQIELDAINWQAGWRDLNTHDRDEFVRRVAEAAAGEAWVSDGNYGTVRHVLWPRATHMVWLDYERPVVMRRVLWRSFSRAVTGNELWPGTGNRESFARWIDKEHPIRWAWESFHDRRRRYGEAMAKLEAGGVPVYRLRRPREAEPLIGRLAAEAREAAAA